MTLKVFIFLLTLVPGLVLAQGVTVLAEAAPEEQSGEPMDHHVDEDEKLLNELASDKAKAAETATMIENSKQDFSSVASNTVTDLQNSGKISLDSFKTMDTKTVEFLRAKLKESHMGDVPAEKVRDLIQSKCAGKPLGRLFERFPVLLDISVDMVRDAEAMPALLGIFLKREQLKTYFYVWLGLLILSIIIKRYLFPKKWHGFKKFSASFAMSLLFLMISLTTFYQLFKEELSPTVRVIAARM